VKDECERDSGYSCRYSNNRNSGGYGLVLECIDFNMRIKRSSYKERVASTRALVAAWKHLEQTKMEIYRLGQDDMKVELARRDRGTPIFPDIELPT